MQWEKYPEVRKFMKSNNLTFSLLGEHLNLCGTSVHALFQRGSCKLEQYKVLRGLDWPENLLPKPKVPTLPGLPVDPDLPAVYSANAAETNKQETEAGV